MVTSALKLTLFKVLLASAIILTTLITLFVLPSKTHAAPGDYTLEQVSISGNTVTWRSLPAGETEVNSLSVVFIKDPGIPLGDPAKEAPLGPCTPNCNNKTITVTYPNGTWTAEISLLGTDKSNDVTFTVPDGGDDDPVVGGTLDCDTDRTEFKSIQEWWNYSRWEVAICGGFADAQTFGLSNVDTTIDALQVIITGTSNIQTERNEALEGTGALTGVSKMITVAYKQPPFSGVQYLAQQFNKLNPVQPAYAQEGIGFKTLTPVQGAWEAMRNISYVGFVIVFVIIGFMVMFRAHISPQAVATVQDSLPRIVIALILVTFSYAIAGLMIDIMFLFLNVAIAALPGDTGAKNIVFEKSILGVIAAGWKDTFKETFDSINHMFEAVIKIPSWISWIIGGLGAIVVGIALLFIMFKVLITLLIAYATIIVLTIAAPFFFLFQALPGNGGAQTWFKQMAANIAVFPTVALMIILAGYLAGIGAWGFGDPAISETAGNIQKFPLLAGDINPAVLGSLAGIAILFMTPAAADLVKNAIGAKGPNVGGGVGTSLAAGAGVLAAGGRRAWDQGPIGNYRKYRQSREQEGIQRRVELESVANKKRKDTFYQP